LDSRKGDYYTILGVSRDASRNQIKRAYRKAALRYHPDRNRSAGAEDMFKEINMAYTILIDEQSRLSYDSELEHPETDVEQTIVTPPPEPKASITKKGKSRFSIIVDPSLCLAFGSCETLAPKVFSLDTDAWINPKVKILDEAGADLEDILAAAQTCPTKAIIIIDRKTGEQIFP
jgi:ferredoxin